MKRKILETFAILTILLTNGVVLADGPQQKMTDLSEKVERKETKPGDIEATVPNWSKYNRADVIRMYGQPEDDVKSGKKVYNSLIRHEDSLKEVLYQEGKLTGNQAWAFGDQICDCSYGEDFGNGKGFDSDSDDDSGHVEELSYDHNRFNVYLNTKKDQVFYATPDLDYVTFR